MRLLLDTHVLIWSTVDPGRLSDDAATAISDPENDLFVSAVSGWEVAVKRAQGRLQFPEVDRALLADRRMVELPISLAHAAEAGALPLHHRDPFDRLLIAQARVDDLIVLTRDRAFDSYDVRRHW
jgi:PIN domain nuclease of toxin-antitoxin system